MTAHPDVYAYILACIDDNRVPDYCLVQRATGLEASEVPGFVSGVIDDILCTRWGIPMATVRARRTPLEEAERKERHAEAVRQYRARKRAERKAAREGASR